MKFLFAFCALLFCNVAKAQISSVTYNDLVKEFFSSKSLQRWIMTGRSGQGNEVPAILFQPIRATAKSNGAEKFITERKVIYQRPVKSIKTDSIVLTAAEKRAIADHLTGKEATEFVWTNEYFPTASILQIVSDSLFHISMNATRYPNGIFEIGLPTFLRNNTVCVFNFAWIWQGGGHASLEVYQRKAGIWVKYGDITGGDW